MSPVIKASRFFLLASIATTFIKTPSFHHYYRISDLLLLISFICILIAIVRKEISVSKDRKLIQIVLFWIGVNVMGTIMSYVLHKDLPVQAVVLNYARLASCLIIFSEIILLAKFDALLLKKSLLFLLGSLIIIPIAYIFQKIGVVHYMMYDPTRFSGLLLDPNYFASFQIIPTLLLLFFLIREDRSWARQAVIYIGFVFSLSMILWSGSRSGILGLIIALAVILFLFIRFSSVSKVRMFMIVLLVIVAAPFALALIPKYTLVPQLSVISAGQPSTRFGIMDKLISSSRNTPRIVQRARVDSFSTLSGVESGQGRFEIWRNSLSFIVKNPLGYGPGYNVIINIRGEGYEHRVAHNIELELLLQGGLLLFVGFNYFLIRLVITTYQSPRFKYFTEIHVLFAILLGILTSALFLDSIPQKWTWIIVALIIAYNRQTSGGTT